MSDEDLERVAREAIEASIWSVPSTSDEPVVHVRHWQVFELDGIRHIVGFHYAILEGRVTSGLQSFDIAGRRAVTKSGRAYVLEGPPGSHPDSDWVLGMWLRPLGKTWRDLRFIPEEELFPDTDQETSEAG